MATKKHGGAAAQDGRDEFGHPRLSGIALTLASEIEKRTGFETRSVVLGHIQRGGSPTAYDRVLATRYGLGAIDMVHRGEFGQMAALRGNKIIFHSAGGSHCVESESGSGNSRRRGRHSRQARL